MYASLLRRYQALVWDGLLYVAALILALFLPLALRLGTTGTRIAMGAFLGFLLLYDPLLVGLRGGTIGHFRYHIRVTDATADQPIGVPRALLRGLIKAFLGLFSLIFMLVTSRAQSLHDLAAHSLVVPIDSTRVLALDVITPAELPSGGMPSRLRRTFVILVYSVMALLAVNLGSSALQSEECLLYNACSTADRLLADALGFMWLLLTAVVLVFGWSGRLPGCRRRATVAPVVG